MIEHDLRAAIKSVHSTISMRQLGRETKVDHARLSRFVSEKAPLTLAQAGALAEHPLVASALLVELLQKFDWSSQGWPTKKKIIELCGRSRFPAAVRFGKRFRAKLKTIDGTVWPVIGGTLARANRTGMRTRWWRVDGFLSAADIDTFMIYLIGLDDYDESVASMLIEIKEGHHKTLFVHKLSQPQGGKNEN